MSERLLGGIFKKIGNFGMDSFEKRVIFQKTVYLMKVFGIDLGYDFNWYIAGPYSPDLAKDGFKLQTIYEHMEKAEIKDKELNENFEEFKKFINPIKNNAHQLELLSSVHFLRSLGMKDRELKKLMLNKMETFNECEIKSAISQLEELGI